MLESQPADNAGGMMPCGAYACLHTHTYPLHPRVLENLSSAEAELGVPDQQFGDEVFGTGGDVGPFLLRELVLPFLDALKQSVLDAEITELVGGQCQLFPATQTTASSVSAGSCCDVKSSFN